jgi:predicted nucleic acid-binding protein
LPDRTLRFTAEQAAEALADYLSFIEMVSIPGKLQAVPRDPEYNAVLECAMEGNAQYIVSGDNDLPVLKQFCGIQIIRASQFLALLPERKARIHPTRRNRRHRASKTIG